MLLQSDKKNFDFRVNFCESTVKLQDFAASFNPHFTCHRFDNTPTALEYIKGLMVCEKNTANLERMEETIDLSDYRRYQHFLSNSTWSHHAVIREVQIQASSVLAVEKARNGEPVGIVIDESAHLKKGIMSVGVSRQYAGLIGKVDNCQVGVYASLCNGTHATLVAERLFLPESWTGDLQRCQRAGIPGEECIPRTKPQLALDIIDECVANGVAFDWVGGDGLYGHSGELTRGLDDRGLFFVLDVHRDQMAYLEEPPVSVSPTGKGNPKTHRIPFRLDTYCAALLDQHWSKVKVRKTAKGWLRLMVHTCRLWIWDGKEDRARERTLVITRTLGKNPKTKYSLSNGGVDEYTPKQYAYFQVQRYWVERTFDDSKNELGLSDYQTRKWIAWHHHHALVFMAALFMMKERVANSSDFPLMSVRDLRILMVVLLFGCPEDFERKLNQMKTRHKKRKRDIDRYYKNDG